MEQKLGFEVQTEKITGNNLLAAPKICFVVPRIVYIRENLPAIPKISLGDAQIVYIRENLLVMPKISLKICGFYEN